MHKYKLNNSNTIYVNWDYYNRVKRLCENMQSFSADIIRAPAAKKDIIVPMPLGKKIYSKKHGVGILIEKKSNGSITVKFDDMTIKYLYPDAFKRGKLEEL